MRTETDELEAAERGVDELERQEQEGESWFLIREPERMEAFLMHVVSDWDHWMYVGSNGAITAGRVGPERALFPYYTQDKVFDLAGTTGGLTRVRAVGKGADGMWEPYRAGEVASEGVKRELLKHASGTAVMFVEEHAGLGLRWECLWGLSRRHGVLRRVRLTNMRGQALRLELVDGLQNLMPAGLDDAFQNQFSNLADAYKRGERLEGADLCLYYLNSIPTDRAEPSESLRATVVWATGMEEAETWLSPDQLTQFGRGEATEGEWEVRGRRFAFLKRMRIELLPGESRCWWQVADVWQSATDVIRLMEELRGCEDPAALLEGEWRQTANRLKGILAGADALQHSAEALRNARHFSNTLYNVLRGGIFLQGYAIARQHLQRHLTTFNRATVRRHQAWLEALPEVLGVEELYDRAAQQQDPDLRRLVRAYLPLVYSRRHGDPSRPWNRFRIELEDADGGIRYGFQGNWRDIFQNWEALLHAYPAFIESVVYRFLNATTADGYNPYRITANGFDWERMDPAEPWSNIGYWGDHQLVYLLKLLEQSRDYHPGLMAAMLSEREFTYAHVPYRIRPFEAILSNPRASIDYSEEDAAAIAERVKQYGADGQFLPGPDGRPFLVNLLEKLLVPLLAKLSNLVPGGGIWMNTQRPEWNDANNALAGYGLSVVTLGYSYRYILHLLEMLAGDESGQAVELSGCLADWLESQASALDGILREGEEAFSASGRQRWVRTLGEQAALHRAAVYAGRLSSSTRRVPVARVRAHLRSAADVVADSLRKNRREDGLYHAYNILRIVPGEGLRVAHLSEMLEGQVSILSSGLLDCRESASLLESLERSALYEPRQQSFLLYPDRDLPGFLQRNRLPEAQAQSSRLLMAHLQSGCRALVERDARGEVRFRADFRNREDLEMALAKLPAGADQALAEEERVLLVQLFEQTFGHDTFTGRSGSFFAYEGLGSIYWHMVSKLALAVLECRQRAVEGDAPASCISALEAHYVRIQRGLGLWKSPALYGAFPTDAYSHTPRNRGAQQPGMTGQVKEDLLTRRMELGLRVRKGCLEVAPLHLCASEFHSAPSSFKCLSVEGEPVEVEVQSGQLAFTVCQVPFLYSIGSTFRIEVHLSDGSRKVISGPSLGGTLSRALFGRTGQIRKIEVDIPARVIKGAE